LLSRRDHRSPRSLQRHGASAPSDSSAQVATCRRDRLRVHAAGAKHRGTAFTHSLRVPSSLIQWRPWPPVAPLLCFDPLPRPPAPRVTCLVKIPSAGAGLRPVSSAMSMLHGAVLSHHPEKQQVRSSDDEPAKRGTNGSWTTRSWGSSRCFSGRPLIALPSRPASAHSCPSDRSHRRLDDGNLCPFRGHSAVTK